jgi:hypothetical protein
MACRHVGAVRKMIYHIGVFFVGCQPGPILRIASFGVLIL